ncbi:MAG: LPS assembly protein LptD [Alphaproteobacteria bacterium]
MRLATLILLAATPWAAYGLDTSLAATPTAILPTGNVPNPLTLTEGTPTSDQGLPFQLNAGQMDLDIKSGTLTASGGVDVKGPEGHLTADSLTYTQSTDALVAKGNVVFTDVDNTTLKVETLTLTGQLKTGTAQALRLAIPQLGEIMQAQSAEKRADNRYVLNNVTYSPCKECNSSGHKPWTIHARTITYVPETPTEGASLRYKHATLDVLGLPVMYLPYFEHPIGPRRAKTGILPPQFGHSTVHGDEARLAATINSPAENADYTLRTRLMSSSGAQVMAERRQITTHTQSEVKASYLNDIRVGKVRSNLAIKGDYVAQPGLRFGLNGEIASDDTYLNDYFNRNDPYLASTLYGELARQDTYAALSTTRFQDLNPTQAPASTAQVLPHAQLEHMLDVGGGTQLTFGGDVVSLQRGQGIQSRRIIAQANLAHPMLWEDGSKLTLGGRLRGDMYNVDGGANNGNIARALPEATLNWEKPYISEGGTHTITPRVMGALSFRGGNPVGAPNEDSVAYELDTNNLFEPSRFAGLDRVESGPRLMYGLDNHWGTAESTQWRLFLGQSIRKYDDNDLPQSGGAATTLSDWVGYAEATPTDWLSFTNRFRLDNATYEIRRMDSGVQLGQTGDWKPWFRTGYSFLDNDTENLNADANLPLTYLAEGLRFSAASKHDLRFGNTLEAQAGLTYRRDCYEISFITRRRGFQNGDIQPSTDYLVNLQLLTLGSETD